jgi:hypothetical protein
MRLPTSSQETELLCWTTAVLGGLQAEYKEKDKTLDGQSANGNVAGSYQETERGSKIHLGPSPSVKIILLFFNRT